MRISNILTCIRNASAIWWADQLEKEACALLDRSDQLTIDAVAFRERAIETVAKKMAKAVELRKSTGK